MNYPTEHNLNVVFAFQASPVTDEKKEISRKFLSDEISAYEYADLAATYLKKEPHKSDCSLHNGPAKTPESCNCGVNPKTTPRIYGSEFPRAIT